MSYFPRYSHSLVMSDIDDIARCITGTIPFNNRTDTFSGMIRDTVATPQASKAVMPNPDALRGDALAQWERDNMIDQVGYVVWSFDTPIAWRVPGAWRIPDGVDLAGKAGMRHLQIMRKVLGQ